MVDKNFPYVQNIAAAHISVGVSDDMARLHVKDGDSGATPFFADDRGVVIEDNTNATLQFLTINTGHAYIQFGSGAGVVGIANAVTVPSTNPTGGGVLYAEAGALKWRSSSGSVTVIA